MSWDSFLELLKCLNPVRIINELIEKQPRIEIVVAVVNILFILAAIVLVFVYRQPLYSEKFIVDVGLIEWLTSFFACVVLILISYWFCCMIIFAASGFSPEDRK